MSKICSKLTVKRAERGHWRRSGIFIVNCGQISNFVLVFSLTLNKWMSVGTHLNRIKGSSCTQSYLTALAQFSGACNFIKKETLTQVFPCEFCEISKSTFFTEHLWATASGTSNVLHYMPNNIINYLPQLSTNLFVIEVWKGNYLKHSLFPKFSQYEKSDFENRQLFQEGS